MRAQFGRHKPVLGSIRRRRHWGWRRAMCDRRIGEASIHIVLGIAVDFEMISMPSENGRMKCVQTYLLALAALSGHLCDFDSIRIPFTPEKNGWRS